MTTSVDYFPLKGGLNLVTPRLALKPGELTLAENYEENRDGGYQRIAGYERYDGQPKPSEANYHVLEFNTGGTTAIAVGDTITGATSSATAYVLAVIVDSGTWAGGDAVGRLVLYDVTGGPFTDTENLQVAAVTRAVADGVELLGWSSTDAEFLAWSILAEERARTLIAAVPGSGPVRGVWEYKGEIYAFRDNAGATACVMHKESASGWVAQNLGAEISFTAGTAEFAVGETVTGGTSSATGVITDFVVTSGGWGTNDAAGYIYMNTLSGTFQAETITSASGSATCSGAQTANALPAGGRYEFVNYNFYGSSGFEAMYGANGVGPAFQWDGNGLAFAHTGMSPDAPTHIAAHKRHLFLTFDSSLQHSSLGSPLLWSAVFGAAEIATGDTITSILPLAGDVLGIWNQDSTYLLYGADVSTWELKAHSLETGAKEWSVQKMGNPLFFDDRGLMTLTTTQAFGDFIESTVSERVKPWLDLQRDRVRASVVLRKKGQYRLFINDNTGLIVASVGKKLSFTRLSYPHAVMCTVSGEDNTGKEIVFFGSDDGMVYQMDSGNSFDGQAVVSLMKLAFSHFGTPRRKKRFRKIVLEVDTPGGALLQFTPEFDYGGSQNPQALTETVLAEAAGGVWSGAVWEDFVWSGPSTGIAEAHIDGVGFNMEVTIRSEVTYDKPYTVQSALIHNSMRGLKR